MESQLAYDAISVVLAAVFLVVILVFVVLSLFLNYHWTRFEMTNEHARRIKTIFFSVSAVLIIVMTITGLIYVF